MIAFSGDQIFLVTGASSGLGEAIALRLNELGGTVIANGRDVARLEGCQAKARTPARIHLAPRDLTHDMEALPLWVRELREQYGKLRGLICCAGHNKLTPLRNYDLDKARALFDIHFHAPILLAKGFADRRNNIGPGAAVVFIASVLGHVPDRGVVTYGSAKGALISATRHLSRELALQGLRANCISPGLVRTGMTENYAVAAIGYDFFSDEEATYPLGLGRASDVADAAAFLLSDGSRWITGKNFILDGGKFY